ncbi:serine/threonine protein kinase [Actinomadura graeca]|uniref:Serine/threonine protein kinase n=1 Tax=Actinomadura graeca TaxID=2750812 RepID=A0ABX8QTA4_9ACTN|nr:serine/threonine-protein kinase [Actinomadura graeca]QXJ21189.1 serine/threonine protein kinase [Actinomadura graeca]
MNEEPGPPPPRRRLTYLDARTGRPAEAEVVATAGDGAVKLETPGGTVEARLLEPGGAGHRALDNEIITGLRVRRCLAGRPHPAEVPALIGYDVSGDGPFALVEPYRGSPCGAEAGRLLPEDLHRFQASLLVGVRVLTAAGIAHRALGPHTVRWDGERVQITGFARAALLGEPREAVGVPPWSAPEQRPEQVSGDVTDRDDLWAAGRLILYMATGEEGAEPDAAALPPELARLVDGLFGPPGTRPDVTGMLRRIEAADPVPYGPEPEPGLVEGRREFFRIRQAKHAETAPGVPDEEPGPDPGPRPGRWRMPRVSPHWAWLGVALIVLLALSAHLIGG